MTQFKKMKMRINNPDHSKAVQEWLFKQGYHWGDGKRVKYTNSKYLFTNSYSANGELTHTSVDEEFKDMWYKEINVQYLDPHLYTTHKSTCVPAKSFTEKPKMKSEFEKLSQQLKHLDKAIDSHEKKQNKRKLDRERIIEKMEGMMPGYSLVRKDSVEEKQGFNPNAIVEGSVWECIDMFSEFHTKGWVYKVESVDIASDLTIVEDDGGGSSWDTSEFVKHFKRIS